MNFEHEFFEDEVRDGFFVPAEIKHAWAAELEVLSEVDRICKNCNWFKRLALSVNMCKQRIDTVHLKLLKIDAKAIHSA